MPAKRPPIPRPLDRQVRVEAGHRCAIPTCRQTRIEVAHIAPWAKVREHTFDNLIALCPTCHSRFDGGEIDVTAMRQYKASLNVMNSRYGDAERRVLTYFAMDPDISTVNLPGGMEVLLHYLLLDGYIELGQSFRGRASPHGIFDSFVIVLQEYRLTAAGRTFVTTWAEASGVLE